MPRRNNDIPSEFDSPVGRISINNSFESTCTKQGEIFTDLSLKQWRLGKPIGIGGFGEIYLASDDLSREVKTDTCYVAKVEKHTNGPLFVEINCYLRIAKEYMVSEWKQQNKLSHLGMPHYVASGSHVIEDEKYRFLIIPKYKKDLERILREKKYFNLKTVLTISYQIMDVLEYIHHHGYIHSDIKAQNIMLESPVKSKSKEVVLRKRAATKKTPVGRKPRKLRNLRPINYNDDIPDFKEFIDLMDKEKLSSPKTGKNEDMCDKIYLLDYGLASKYRQLNGEHKEFCTDERKAHAGTILFCSRDAHKGVPSRRSDLESLGYNIIYWLTGNLLWSEDVDDPAVVERKKNKCMADIPNFLGYCFNGDCPKFLMEYFTYIGKLKFEEYPNYEYCRQLFKKAVNEYGYKDDMRLDLENLEGWGSKQKKIKSRGRENIKPRVLISIGPPKLTVNSKTNILFKRPKLRKKAKANEKDSMMNWSKILVDNPEEIVRAARERKNTEGSDSNIFDMDIESMNPTYAMLEVYNKYIERSDISPRYKGESTVEHVEGYTPAMMSVLIKKIERDLLEEEKIVTKNVSTKRSKSNKGPSKKKRSQTMKKVEPPRFTRVTRSRSSALNNNNQSSPPKMLKSVPITRQKNSLRG